MHYRSDKLGGLNIILRGLREAFGPGGAYDDLRIDEFFPWHHVYLFTIVVGNPEMNALADKLKLPKKHRFGTFDKIQYERLARAFFDWADEYKRAKIANPRLRRLPITGMQYCECCLV